MTVRKAADLFKSNGMEVPVRLEVDIEDNAVVEVGWMPEAYGHFVVWHDSTVAVPFEDYARRVTDPEVAILAKAIPLLWEAAASARDKAVEDLATQAVGIGAFITSRA